MISTWKHLLILGLIGSCTAASAAPFVVSPDGRIKEGLSIRARSNGDVILTTDRGDITYVKGQYSRAVADQPSNWDKVSQDVQSNPAAAIPALQVIIKENANLEWDLRAMALLGQAQVGAGKVDEGISTYESVFRKSPEMARTDARWGYYDAMVAAKKYNKLELALKKEIKEGAHEDAAKAQIIRGDILMSQGDTQGAAMDYLKTVLLFKKARSVQAEALYKAGEALDKLKDPRASDQFKEVVQTYPDSPWANKARAKL